MLWEWRGRLLDYPSTAGRTKKVKRKKLIGIGKSRQKRHKLKKIYRDTIVALGFIMPGMIVFFVFRLGAVIFSFYISLHKYRLLEKPIFIGLQNFTNTVRDSIFLLTVKNTAYLLAGTVPAIILVSLALAIILNTQLRGRNFFRVLFFSPLMIPLAIAAIAWARSLDSAWGEWNWLFGFLGIPPQGWLSNPRHAMIPLIIVNTWRNIGFYMMLFLAGLQDIPRQFIESAEIDGANKWICFWHITLPLLKPVLFFVTIMSVISISQVFVTPQIMTGGGPSRATLTVVLHLYRTGFRYYRMGEAATMSWLLFGIIFTLAILNRKLFGKERRY